MLNLYVETGSLLWISQCQKLLACKNEDCGYSSGEVEATTPPIVLRDLLSYARYTVHVAALAASWGPSKQLQFATVVKGTWNLYSECEICAIFLYRFSIIISFHITLLLGFCMLVLLSSNFFARNHSVFRSQPDISNNHIYIQYCLDPTADTIIWNQIWHQFSVWEWTAPTSLPLQYTVLLSMLFTVTSQEQPSWWNVAYNVVGQGLVPREVNLFYNLQC